MLKTIFNTLGKHYEVLVYERHRRQQSAYIPPNDEAYALLNKKIQLIEIILRTLTELRNL